MSTPALKAVREAFPDARVDFFVGSWSRQTLVGNPCIDNIVDCGRVGSGPYSVGDYWALIRRMRQGKYDACFVLERSFFLTLLPFLAGVPRRIGLDSEGRGFSLTTKVPCEATRHEVELYLDVIRAIGLDPRSPRLEFYPSSQDVESARRRLRDAGLAADIAAGDASAEGIGLSLEVRGDLRGRPPLVAIHPAGGANPGMDMPAKRWPARRFAVVADRLIEQYGATVLILGAESDLPVAEEMEREMQRHPINMAGTMNLGELAAVLARCDLFLGNDTGPMHLAVAVGTPVVAVFGPTDARMYGPYSSQATVVSSDVPCGPCFKKGAARPCATFECILKVGVDDVWQAVQTRLAVRGFQKLNSVAKWSV